MVESLPKMVDDGEKGHDWRIDRRVFLGGATTLTVAAAAEAVTQQRRAVRTASQLLADADLLQIHAAETPTFTLDVRRREDVLLLRFDGYNLVRKGQTLVRKQPRKPATLVVSFLPQHLAEQVFLASQVPTVPGSSSALLAAPSRLAFSMPSTLKAIPLTIEGLLSWGILQPALTPVATFAGARRAKGRALSRRAAPTLRAPRADETAIELPWRLALSPTSAGRWDHAVDAPVRNGAVELWHTELKTAGQAGGPVRAVWNYDFASPATPQLKAGEPSAGDTTHPFRASLTPNQRFQIVMSTSDFTLPGRADVEASRLALSARGGFLTSDGKWDTRYGLTEWQHEATLGRDQFVKVSEKGFLLPFGHRVTLVAVTQREFAANGGQTVAALKQRTYILVRDPVVSYDPAANPTVAFGGRDFPFRTLELTTTRTPILDDAVPFFAKAYQHNFHDHQPFIPQVAGAPFQWQFIGTDWSGRTATFTVPALFAGGETDAFADTTSFLLRGFYNLMPTGDPRRTADLHGQTIAMAESVTAGDTDAVAHAMTFGASPGLPLGTAGYLARDRPHCVPSLLPVINGSQTGAQVTVRLPAVEQATGGAPLNGNPLPAISYYPAFVTQGFSTLQKQTANAGNVYAQLQADAKTATNLAFGGGSAGGVLTPNLQMQGLSRSLGPVADLDNIFKGTFDPATVFGGLGDALKAKILGGVPLADLLDAANILDGVKDPGLPNDKALKVTAKRAGEVLTTTVKFVPNIKNDNPVITPRGNGTTTSFVLTCVITTDLRRPTESQKTITGELNEFVVNLIDVKDPFIAITFNKLIFTSVNGQKPKVKVVIADVKFVGALKFVQQLQSFLDFSGGGGPNISALIDGITSALDVKLPSIDVGIISLSHVSIGSGFHLPYDGSPALFRFNFATRDNPFQLAVGIFGGGGFLNLALGTGPLETIEASFEFGAMAAFDIGVASGSVQLEAGFYFSFGIDTVKKTQGCILTGFVKLSGNLSVLDIITISLEFDLALTFQEPPAQITGTATLIVSIALLFFHKSVTLTASKTFVNDSSSNRGRRAIGGPQTFADQVTQNQWNAYCSAFAPVS